MKLVNYVIPFFVLAFGNVAALAASPASKPNSAVTASDPCASKELQSAVAEIILKNNPNVSNAGIMFDKQKSVNFKSSTNFTCSGDLLITDGKVLLNKQTVSYGVRKSSDDQIEVFFNPN